MGVATDKLKSIATTPKRWYMLDMSFLVKDGLGSLVAWIIKLK